MDQPDLRLLAIAGPPFVDESSIVAACEAAVGGGVTAVQVRLKDLPASMIMEATEQLVQVLSVPVYVNDRADIAVAARASGVHLGTDDLAPSGVRLFAPTSFKIGVSVGTHEEADTALTQSADYWSTGSIFPTQSKVDAGEPIGLDGFRELARRAPRGVPVIAIGGISAINARDILEAGARGIAVISAVFGVTDIEHAARELRDIVDATLGG
jgi:thiamine-phosphate pyrophosphorylase